MNYTVTVGNIGNFEADGLREAVDLFNYCVSASKCDHGRASGEPIVLFKDGDIFENFEYYPPVDPEIKEA